MDITSNNFEETLPEIRESINLADFISIDTEFTGLEINSEITAYDTPPEYYYKIRKGIVDFLVLQIGICCFKFNKFKNKYEYKAFNFYIFPRPINGFNFDVHFVCKASNVNFLVENGLNFSKVFKEGISYLTTIQEKNLLDELKLKYRITKSDVFSKVHIPPALTPVVENACARIKQFLSSENTENEIYFENCNGFVRKLIFQTAYERFSTDNFSLSTKWINNSPVLVAQKGKSKVDQDEENYNRDFNKIKNAVGFSKVIEFLSNSKKLIVGHNMLIDVCHIVHRLYSPLPEDFREFKKMVHKLFPRLMDTKYMCNSHPFKEHIPSSTMRDMIEKLKKYPFHYPKADAKSEEFGYPVDSDKQHEAGYDALITGLSFIALTTFLGNKNTKNKNVIKIPFIMSALKAYENRLFIMKVFDYSYINLQGDEPKPSRKHVFHVTFPKDWKYSDIIQLFSPYGGVRISYCSSSSAWVTLLNENKHGKVETDLINSTSSIRPNMCDKLYTVLTYDSYHEKYSDKSKVICSPHCEENNSTDEYKMRSSSSSSSYSLINEEQKLMHACYIPTEIESSVSLQNSKSRPVARAFIIFIVIFVFIIGFIFGTVWDGKILKYLS